MTRLAAFLSLCSLCAVGASCTPDATEPELKAMCEKLVELRGEVKLIDLDKAVAEVEQDFAEREKNNKRAAEMEVEDWDEELQAKVKELKAAMAADDVEDEEKPTEEDLRQLEEKFAAKKVETEKRYAERAKQLGPDKELGLEAVRDKVKRAEEAFAKAVGECLSEAGKDAVPQPIAQCRAKATALDQYWNQCR
jgi:hypothetical protein